MTMVERHAELVYAESLFEKVSYSLLLPVRATTRPQGSSGRCVFRRLVGVHQRSVSGFSPIFLALASQIFQVEHANDNQYLSTAREIHRGYGR